MSCSSIVQVFDMYGTPLSVRSLFEHLRKSSVITPDNYSHLWVAATREGCAAVHELLCPIFHYKPIILKAEKAKKQCIWFENTVWRCATFSAQYYNESLLSIDSLKITFRHPYFITIYHNYGQIRTLMPTAFSFFKSNLIIINMHTVFCC